MSIAMQQDIDKITQCTGGQNQKPPKAMPEKTAEKMDKHSSDNHIAHQVHNVGVQGESGHQAVPLPVLKDLLSGNSTLGKPVATFSPWAGNHI